MSKKVLLIDFDGVIVDTFAVCVETNNQVWPNVSVDEYRKQFEGNIYKSLNVGHEEVVDEKDSFFKLYIPKMLKADLVQGMQKVIDQLKEKYLLVIVSSSVNSPIEEYLTKHGMMPYFDKVFGVNVHKSKVAKIKMVFKEYEVGPQDCLFIPDTLGDMREAREAGVDALGVTWGWHPRETLEKGSPFAIVDTPQEIVSAVDRYFK